MYRFFSLFLFIFNLITFSSSQSSSSSYSAYYQIRYWSENVQNPVPEYILSKLSPLDKPDSEYYSTKVSFDNFKADSYFCSKARLACYVGLYQPYRIQGLYQPYRIQGLYQPYKRTYTLGNEQIVPFSYFLLSDLKEGNTFYMPRFYTPRSDTAFLPKEIASKISFVSPDDIKYMFPNYTEEAIDTAFSYCNAPAITGQLKTCAKSLEEMIDFAKTALGKSKLMAYSSRNISGLGTTKVKINRIIRLHEDEKAVVCRQLDLPYTSYYCYSNEKSQIRTIHLAPPKTGAPASDVLAMCNLDTSSWPADHLAFKVLKSRPGEGDVCQWLTSTDLAFVGY